MPDEIFKNVCGNISMLLKAAKFFKKISEHSDLKSAKDHVLIQRFANLIIQSGIEYAEVGRDFAQFDFFEAYFSLEKANQTKTAGSVLYLPQLFKPQVGLLQMIEIFHDTTMLNPLYILSSMKVAEICGESVTDKGH